MFSIGRYFGLAAFYFLNLDAFEVETIKLKPGKPVEFLYSFSLFILGAETDENERPSCCCAQRQGAVGIHDTAVFP